MATITEKLSSGSTTGGASPQRTLLYLIEGESDESTAATELLAEAPETVDVATVSGGTATLPRTNYRLEPIESENSELWLGYVEYGYRTSGAVNTDTNPSTFAAAATSFTTVGATEHIEFSKETVARYPANGEASREIDHGKAIGVTKTGIKGVDITVPKFEWTETYELPAATVTDAYLLTLRRLTGRANSQGWRGFDAREVLFLGATGRRERGGPWRVDFQFRFEATASGVEVGYPKVITITEKAGHDYVWFETDVTADSTNGSMTTQPSCAYVERVYDESDLFDLGIGA